MLEFENSFTLPTPPPHRFYESQNPAQGQQSPCASGGSGTAAPKGGRIQDGPRTCVYGGRLQRYGKSKRSEPPPGGRRSDSPGIFYKFPAQRSSGSVRVALRLSRPPGLRHARACLKIAFCKMYVTVCGKFVPKSGGVAGYAD